MKLNNAGFMADITNFADGRREKTYIVFSVCGRDSSHTQNVHAGSSVSVISSPVLDNIKPLWCVGWLTYGPHLRIHPLPYVTTGDSQTTNMQLYDMHPGLRGLETKVWVVVAEHLVLSPKSRHPQVLIAPRWLVPRCCSDDD